MATDLINIPGVGECIAQHLINAGYPDIESLKEQNPDDVYVKDYLYQGVQVDRCAFYCCRLAVHYANYNGQLPPDKLNWWNWK